MDNGLTFKSNNDLAIELINGYEPPSDEQVYVLVDSWYTSKKKIDACSAKGYQLIGGLRTNRKIYPAGIGIKLSKFISDYIQADDLHSVTVCHHRYKIYSYEGNLSDTENATVLVSWENNTNQKQNHSASSAQIAAWISLRSRATMRCDGISRQDTGILKIYSV